MVERSGVAPLARLLVGICISWAALALVTWHLRVRRSWLQRSPSDARTHYLRQSRQRMWTSGLIGLIGALMVGSFWVHDPLVLTIGLLAVMVLIVLIFLSALLDATRSQHYFRSNDAGVTEAKKKLVEEYQRLKDRGDS